MREVQRCCPWPGGRGAWIDLVGLENGSVGDCSPVFGWEVMILHFLNHLGWVFDERTGKRDGRAGFSGD